MMLYPKLIAVDAFPVEEDGKNLYCIRDPQNSDTNPLIVSELALYIMTFFDGNNTVDSIIAQIKNKYGREIKKSEFESLIEMLDDALLLENEKYFNHQKAVENSFYNSDTRVAYLSNLSYPGSKDKLTALLDDFYVKAKNKIPTQKRTGLLRGIISPHIDFTRGGTSYALAYRELLEGVDADTYLIFGTTHYAQNDNPFIVTRKSFSTPLGTADTNTQFIDILEKKCGWDICEGEIFHRTEHSIWNLQRILMPRVFTDQLKKKKTRERYADFPQSTVC